MCFTRVRRAAAVFDAPLWFDAPFCATSHTPFHGGGSTTGSTTAADTNPSWLFVKRRNVRQESSSAACCSGNKGHGAVSSNIYIWIIFNYLEDGSLVIEHQVLISSRYIVNACRTRLVVRFNDPVDVGALELQEGRCKNKNPRTSNNTATSHHNDAMQEGALVGSYGAAL